MVRWKTNLKHSEIKLAKETRKDWEVVIRYLLLKSASFRGFRLCLLLVDTGGGAVAAGTTAGIHSSSLEYYTESINQSDYFSQSINFN